MAHRGIGGAAVAVAVLAMSGVVAMSGTAAAGTAGTAGTAGGVRPRIVGGQDARPGQFPWMVRLSMGCGGAVVTRWVVLTAAHCVTGSGSNDGIEATIGRTRLSAPGGQTIRSRYVLRSPRYAQQSTADWALVELAEPTSAPPLDLAPQGDTAAEHGTLTILGWGATAEGGPQSDTLQFATVPFLADTTCQESYPGKFQPETELCAGYSHGGVDACQGDSGGPMVADVDGRQVQVGIVSYGVGCARPGYPGVYAEVPAFAAEINSHLSGDGQLLT